MKLATGIFFTLCTIICFSVTESSAKDSLSIETVIKQEQPKLHGGKRTGGLLKGIAQCVVSAIAIPPIIYAGLIGGYTVFSVLTTTAATGFFSFLLLGSLLGGCALGSAVLVAFTMTWGIQNINAYIHETSEPEYGPSMVTLIA